jgi:probable rRNA maturation factor
VPTSARPIAIRNAHPRLRIPRGAVAKAIALLNEQFEMLPGDLPYLSLPRPRLTALKSRIELPSKATSNPKSRISAVCPAGELSIVFLSDPALAQIHADFMDDPTATDVITFEGDPMAELAGEICVSADTALRFVEGSRPREPLPARTQALQNSFATELTLYVVHGWLHLSGYDDLQPAKKRRMRAAEKRAMALLQQAKAIPAFRLA